MPILYSPEEKAEILKQHFIGKRPVADICEQYRIDTDVFEKWEKTVYENTDLIFRKHPHDGMEYYQNYDLVINWLSEAFRDRTLDVLGIKTGKIRRVCSYRPAEISVSAGILDVIFEDSAGKGYHVEEQRNLTEEDLYRFASQHFSAAKEWQDNIADIVLSSGRPYTGRKEIHTLTGKYAPTVVDLTQRDGPARFEEIREAVNRGDTSVLTELVFLPLYGREEKIQFVRKVLQFEIDLCKKGKMPIQLVAATLIMSNKQIDRATFNELWEEIKMLDVLKFAHEKGKEEGKLETAREMILRFLEESVGVVPAYISDQIMSISRPDILVRLVKQSMICRKIEDFETMLQLATREPRTEKPLAA